MCIGIAMGGPTLYLRKFPFSLSFSSEKTSCKKVDENITQGVNVKFFGGFSLKDHVIFQTFHFQHIINYGK